MALISQWLGHKHLETTLIYAYADTEAKREAIEKAMGDGALQGIDGRKYTVNDEDLKTPLWIVML